MQRFGKQFLVNKNLLNATKYAYPKINTVRFFSDHLTIPTDKEHQTGRRKQEIDAEERGEVAFNRDPIIPNAKQGTKENPILVPSGEDSRVVGYEDPATHQLVWFTLEKGPLHYIPSIGLYFKMEVLQH